MTAVRNSETGPALPRVLCAFWIGSLVAFCLMIVVGWVRWRGGALQTHYNPLAHLQFSDLLEYVPTFHLLHTAAFFHNPRTSPVAYPPFSAVIYAAVYATGRPVAVYLVVAALWLAVLTVGTGRWLVRLRVPGLAAWLVPLTVLLMAFPCDAMVLYGNIELFLWIFAAAGTWAFCRDKPELAAMLWGCAAAMKLYPIIFLVLLWPGRRWRAAACGIGTFAGVTLLSLWYLGPTLRIAALGSLHNVFGYQGVRVAEWTIHELATNHSAFNWVKFALRVSDQPFATATLPYFACGALLFAGLYFGRVSRLPRSNQVLFVTAFMLVLPPISYAHTLTHLFAPLVLLLGVAMEAEHRGETVNGLRVTLALFVPLFASFMLLTERSLFLFGGLIQSAILLMIFYRSARYPFTSHATADLAPFHGSPVTRPGQTASVPWSAGVSV